MLAIDPPVPWTGVLLNALVGAVGALALVVARRGAWSSAALILVWGVWVAVTLVAASNGGVRGPNLINYPVIIVFAGWILGPRPTLVLTAATAFVLLGFMALDKLNILPPAHYGNLKAYGIYLTGILLVTAAATLLSRHSYLRRVQDAQDIASTLEASDVQLRKLSAAVEQSPESVVITDAQGRIEFINDSCLKRMGWARSEMLGTLSSSFTEPGWQARVQEAVSAEGKGWRREQSARRKDGSEVTELVMVAPIREPDGTVSHFVELKQDITERKRAAHEIHRLARSDALTGLPNRTMLMEQLSELQLREGRPPRAACHALLLLDIDQFTTFNQARGSDKGDQLLRAVAKGLRSVTPEHALLVRVASDEFALLLCEAGSDTAQAGRRARALVETVQNEVFTHLKLDGDADELSMRASIGITFYPQGPQDTAQEALRRGGTALHRAKQMGGGHCAFFERAMGEAAEQRFRVERELRQAIAQDELRLFLQPQVDVDGVVQGAEVLVRWQHPQQGLLAPGAFIAVAEESGLIVALGDWVLAHSCALLARPVFNARQLRLSVNLSALQFRQPDFVAQVQQLLAATGANAKLLTLEVTESVVIDDMEDAIAKMHALTALGVELSLDDFGTGYSSLAYLKRLPIQELKIDRTFVQDAPHNADDGVLVEGILAVASHFGLRVVAEGVETPAQVDFLRLRAPGVLYQGYLFGRPEPQADWLARWDGQEFVSPPG